MFQGSRDQPVGQRLKIVLGGSAKAKVLLGLDMMVAAGAYAPPIALQGGGDGADLLSKVVDGTLGGGREIIRHVAQIAQGAQLQSEAETIVWAALCVEPGEVGGREREVGADVLRRDLGREANKALAVAVGQERDGAWAGIPGLLAKVISP